MAETTELLFQLKALDEVSATVKKIQTQISGIQGTVKEANTSLSTLSIGFKALGAAAAGALAVLSVRSVTNFIGDAINSASQAETAINELNFALKASGIFTEQASKDFQDFASSLQETSKFADDVILQNAALLQSFGQFTNEGLKVATQAAVDFAAATGKDLGTAIQLIGKAANGNVEALKRYGIEVQKGKDDAESFANALDVLNKKFAGAAANQLNTYAGSITLVKNQYDDLLESIGNVIIKNPALIKLIQSTANIFIRLKEVIEDNSLVLGDFVTGAIGNLSTVFVGVISVVGSVVKVLNFFKLGLLTLGEIVLGFGEIVANVFFGIQESIRTLSFEPIKGGLKDAADTAIKTVNNIADLGAEYERQNEFISEFTDSLKDLNAETKRVPANLEKIANTKTPGPLLLPRVDQEALKKANDDIKNAFKNVEGSLKNVGLTQLQIIDREKSERIKAINDAAKIGLINSKSAAEFRTKVELDATNKILVEQKKAAEEAAKKSKEAFDKAFKNPIQAIFQQGALSVESTIGAVGGIAGSIVQGAQGAANLLTDGIQLGLTAIAGPLGGIIGEAIKPLLDVFFKGPDEVRKMVREFFKAIPELVQNLLKSIPVFVKELMNGIIVVVQNLPEILITAIKSVVETFFLQFDFITFAVNLLQAIADLLPEFFELLLAEAVPFIEGLVEKITENLPQIAQVFALALANQAPFIATTVALRLQAEMPRIATTFINELIKNVPTLIKAMVKEIAKQFGAAGFSSILSGGGGGGGGFSGIIGGAIGSAVGSIGKAFGFAEGGLVPQGFPGDSFPARLTSGERVLTDKQNEKLEQFLNNQSTGSQNLTVNLAVGEDQLASILLNLNKQGFRIS